MLFLSPGVTKLAVAPEFSEYVREWTQPHAIYYSYFGDPFNAARREGRHLGMSWLPKPGHQVPFLPLPTASASGSENHGPRCFVKSCLFFLMRQMVN